MSLEEASDLTTFVKQIELFDLLAHNIIFRGQSCHGDLLPSIARADPTKNTTNKEKELLKQLTLMGATYLNNQSENPWDLLVLAQHFGMKTRLLDWTSNPFAALWFACTDNHDGDVFVYVLEADNLLLNNAYKKSPFEIEATKVFQPKLSNPRIIAQHGWFTAHRFSKGSKKFVALEKNPKIKNNLTEIKIPKSARSCIVDALDRFGINNKTLFPDLEGLCRYLNWKQKRS